MSEREVNFGFFPFYIPSKSPDNTSLFRYQPVQILYWMIILGLADILLCISFSRSIWIFQPRVIAFLLNAEEFGSLFVDSYTTMFLFFPEILLLLQTEKCNLLVIYSDIRNFLSNSLEH